MNGEGGSPTVQKGKGTIAKFHPVYRTKGKSSEREPAMEAKPAKPHAKGKGQREESPFNP